MKPYAKLFAAALAVGSIVACGAAGDSEGDSELSDLPPDESEVSLDVQDVPSVTTIEEEEAVGGVSEEDGVIVKKCWATCTVIDLAPNDPYYCPVTIGGYGSKWFSCNTACNIAKSDAVSKLPSGCTINNCNLTGC